MIWNFLISNFGNATKLSQCPYNLYAIKYDYSEKMRSMALETCNFNLFALMLENCLTYFLIICACGHVKHVLDTSCLFASQVLGL